jgi:hypothetical protein
MLSRQYIMMIRALIRFSTLKYNTKICYFLRLTGPRFPSRVPCEALRQADKILKYKLTMLSRQYIMMIRALIRFSTLKCNTKICYFLRLTGPRFPSRVPCEALRQADKILKYKLTMLSRQYIMMIRALIRFSTLKYNTTI